MNNFIYSSALKNEIAIISRSNDLSPDANYTPPHPTHRKSSTTTRMANGHQWVFPNRECIWVAITMIFTEEDQLPFYTCDLKLFPGDNHKQTWRTSRVSVKRLPLFGFSPNSWLAYLDVSLTLSQHWGLTECSALKVSKAFFFTTPRPARGTTSLHPSGHLQIDFPEGPGQAFCVHCAIYNTCAESILTV